jgi:hypothetical protein
MGLPRREVAVWVLLAAALVGLRTIHHGGPILGYDSFQYMSVAENLAAGNGIRTSIAHFEPERSHGVLPAPMTWFPAGYPALMTVLALVGISPMWAGFLVSGTAFCALVATTAWLCSWYGLSAAAARLTLFCLIANSMAITFSAAVLSESTFTALSVGSLAMLLAASSEGGTAHDGSGLALWALSGLATGLSCWIRYTGLFLFAGVGLYLSLEILRDRRRDLRGPLLAVAAAGALTAALLLRNVYLVGTWRGGNTKAVSETALYVARRSAAAIYQLFLGALRLERLGVPELLLALAGSVCACFGITALWHNRAAVARNLKDRPSLMPLLTYLGVYAAAMIYLTFFSTPHVSARYCYPVLPLLLVLIGLLVTLVAPNLGRTRHRGIALASVVAVVASYLFLNVRDAVEPSLSRSALIERRIAKFFEEPTPSGEPLRRWVDANIPADASIVATDGQPTAFVLRRNTVSLASLDYRSQAWEEPQVRELMSRFHAAFLILYRGTPALAVPVEQSESQFLRTLARGEQPSDWLQLATRNPYVLIFRRTDLTGGRVRVPSRAPPHGQELARRPLAVLHLGQPVRPLEHLARTAAVGRADDAVPLHRVEDARGTAVTEPEAALQRRG